MRLVAISASYYLQLHRRRASARPARNILTTCIAESTTPRFSYSLRHLHLWRATSFHQHRTSFRTIQTTRASPHRNFGLTSHLVDNHRNFITYSFYPHLPSTLSSHSSPLPTLSSSSRAKLPPTLGRCIPSGAASSPPHHPFHRTPHFSALRISSHFTLSSHHFTVFRSFTHFLVSSCLRGEIIRLSSHTLIQSLRSFESLEFIHKIHHLSCLMLCMRGNVTAESCIYISIRHHSAFDTEGPGRDNNADSDRADDSERTFSIAFIIHHIDIE